MSEAGPKSSGAWVVGTVVGILLAALFVWLFTIFLNVSYLPAAIVPVVLLVAWAIFSAVAYGRTSDSTEDH